jgi:hypothetical protein
MICVVSFSFVVHAYLNSLFPNVDGSRNGGEILGFELLFFVSDIQMANSDLLSSDNSVHMFDTFWLRITHYVEFLYYT